MDFSAMDYAKVTAMVQTPRWSHLQETTTVEFTYHIKEYPRLSERAKKTFLSFPATYLWLWFSLGTAAKTTYCNRLNAEADIRIQLSFIKADVKEICKNHATFLTILFIN